MSNIPATPPGDDLPDGLRLVDGIGDSFKVIDPDGRTSVLIQASAKDAHKPFRVRYWKTNQEILNAAGTVIAKTTDPEMAKHVCHLLIAYKNIQDRKAASAS